MQVSDRDEFLIRSYKSPAHRRAAHLVRCSSVALCCICWCRSHSPAPFQQTVLLRHSYMAYEFRRFYPFLLYPATQVCAFNCCIV